MSGLPRLQFQTRLRDDQEFNLKIFITETQGLKNQYLQVHIDSDAKKIFKTEKTSISRISRINFNCENNCQNYQDLKISPLAPVRQRASQYLQVLKL